MEQPIPELAPPCLLLIVYSNSQEPHMKVLSSLKDAKTRHRDCQIVRRRGRIYVICKSNPRFKARQGGAKSKKA